MNPLVEEIEYIKKKKEEIQNQIMRSSKPHPDDWEEMKMLTKIEDSLYRLYTLEK